MTRLTRTAIGFALWLILSPTLAGAAAAQVVLPPAGGAVLRNDAGDLSIIQNRLQRQQYQQQQQRFREDDRLAMPRQPQRQDLPAIKPACRAQVYGGRVLGNCR